LQVQNFRKERFINSGYISPLALKKKTLKGKINSHALEKRMVKDRYLKRTV